MFLRALFRKRPNAAERARIDRVRILLSEYPVFTPPYMANAGHLSKDEATENFQYLLDHQSQRMEAFFSFLSHYDVIPGHDASGLLNISSWFSESGGLLLAYSEYKKMSKAFLCFNSKWEGELASLNVVLDLGIFLAQCLMLRNQKLTWHLTYLDRRDRTPVSTKFFLRGFKPQGRYMDPLNEAFVHCLNAAHKLENKGRPHSADFLRRWVEDWASR